MPNIRTLTLISQTLTLTTFEDPTTLKAVLATTDEAGIPLAVTIDATPLALTSTVDNRRTFVGTVAAALWQIDLFGVGGGMTGRATTRG